MLWRDLYPFSLMQNTGQRVSRPQVLGNNLNDGVAKCFWNHSSIRLEVSWCLLLQKLFSRVVVQWVIHGICGILVRGGFQDPSRPSWPVLILAIIWFWVKGWPRWIPANISMMLWQIHLFRSESCKKWWALMCTFLVVVKNASGEQLSYTSELFLWLLLGFEHFASLRLQTMWGKDSVYIGYSNSGQFYK